MNDMSLRPFKSFETRDSQIHYHHPISPSRYQAVILRSSSLRLYKRLQSFLSITSPTVEGLYVPDCYNFITGRQKRRIKGALTETYVWSVVGLIDARFLSYGV